MIEIKKTKDKVCIVGFAPTWNKTPFTDDSFEVWGLNELYSYFQQVPGSHAERWFEIHSPNSPSKNTPQHQAWLKKATIPVYMQKHFDNIPASVAYPKEEVFKFFEEKGYMGAKYFTNSISYMIALAIYEGYKEIHIYGVDMAQDSEYAFQRPSCEYFIGIAEGMGIKVYIPCESDLVKAGILYGYESDNTMRLKIKGRIKELQKNRQTLTQQHAKLSQQIKQLEQQIVGLDGAISDANYWLKNWS
jgi:hypothetical protein